MALMRTHDRLSQLYNTTFGTEPVQVTVLRADGSNREIYRLLGPDNEQVIGVHGPDAAENRAFITFSRQLRGADLPVPKIFGYSEEHHLYLEEDLGDFTLYDRLKQERTGEEFPATMLPPYRAVVKLLPHFQVTGGRVLDFSLSIPRAEFDRRSMLWDLHYFKYMFLRLTGVQFDEERLEDDFERLTDFLLEGSIEHFLYRDFQSRNIMLRGESLESAEPWFIDYQGGRRGALQYDIASLLYDAKADLPAKVRNELLELYLDSLSELIDFDRDEFLRLFPGFVLIRALQAMGAYGYRGLHEGKQHFIDSIPYGIRNILTLLNTSFPVELPELAETFEWVAQDYQIPTKSSPILQDEKANHTPPHTTPLALHITSFSYKKGSYPLDETEHGGGYVFDCRPLHNPGRYAEFKEKTGMDEEVSSFLSGNADVETFWEHVAAIVENAVEKYQERQFDYLSVAFGCTGGQHRSVYFAERLAEHLRQHHPSVTTTVHHREQEIVAKR
ncbi:MAG: RNase adapter RapZ [Candidatus Kapaibacterium sp.]